jgi:hypothetical protein
LIVSHVFTKKQNHIGNVKELTAKVARNDLAWATMVRGVRAESAMSVRAQPPKLGSGGLFVQMT